CARARRPGGRPAASSVPPLLGGAEGELAEDARDRGVRRSGILGRGLLEVGGVHDRDTAPGRRPIAFLDGALHSDRGRGLNRLDDAGMAAGLAVAIARTSGAGNTDTCTR